MTLSMQQWERSQIAQGYKFGPIRLPSTTFPQQDKNTAVDDIVSTLRDSLDMNLTVVSVLAFIGMALAASAPVQVSTPLHESIRESLTGLMLARCRSNMQQGWKYGKLRFGFLSGTCNLRLIVEFIGILTVCY